MSPEASKMSPTQLTRSGARDDQSTATDDDGMVLAPATKMSPTQLTRSGAGDDQSAATDDDGMVLARFRRCLFVMGVLDRISI
jgi:hypothetical protein